MKFTRTILFLLMFAFVSACNSTTLAPIIPPTDEPSPIVEVTATAPSPTPTEISTLVVPTPEVIKEFPICKIEKFRDCPITAEDLLNGNYFRWLQTLSKPFDQSKIKEVPFAETVVASSPSQPHAIIYNPATAPNFSDPSTAPFRRNVTFGVLEYEVEGVKSFAMIKPIEFYDKNEPTRNKWVITLDSYYRNGSYPGGDIAPYLAWDINAWKTYMRITPIAEGTLSIHTGLEDPVLSQAYAAHPEMSDRFQRFLAGDVSALSGPGIIAMTYDVQASGGAYK